MSKMHELRSRLDLLAPLAVLLETQSVTIAANRIGVTQPAMSRTLERLRSHFGDPLLVRSGGKMLLTPRAEALRDPLRAVLAAASDLYAPASFDAATAIRDFRVVIPDVVAAPLLPVLLGRMAQEAPGCRLHLRPWTDDRETLKDIDFIVSTELSPFPNFRTERLSRDRDVLAFRKEVRPEGDPFLLPHVAVVAAGLAEDPVDSWLQTHGRKRNIVTIVPHYLLALQLVARAGLCAILPSKTVSTLGPQLGILSGELPIDQESEQQWLIYPPQLDTDPGSRWLRKLVHAVCA